MSDQDTHLHSGSELKERTASWYLGTQHMTPPGAGPPPAGLLNRDGGLSCLLKRRRPHV